MYSKDEWISNIIKDFKDVNYDVLSFIYDIKSRSASVYGIFASSYCYYFANMLQIAFSRGDVCWSAGIGHIVWRDINGTAYDISGVYSNYTRLLPIEYLGDLVVDFKHTGVEYIPTSRKIRDWCEENKVKPIVFVTTMWRCLPDDCIHEHSTIEEDILLNWEKYINNMISVKGSVYRVEDLIDSIPPSIRKLYTNDRECILSNMMFIEGGFKL